MAAERNALFYVGLGLAGVSLIAAVVAGKILADQARDLEVRSAEFDQRASKMERTISDAEADAERYRDEIASARALKERSLRKAEEQAELLERARSERLSAEEARAVAEQLEKEALEAAAEARRQAAEERRRRGEEWDRLLQALRLTAPTTRTGWTIGVQLDGKLPDFDPKTLTYGRQGREVLSRIAGIMLGVTGYRAAIEQGDTPWEAEAVKRYFIEAGVPPEVISRTVSNKSVMRLRIVDTILNDPVPLPPEPELPEAPAAVLRKPPEQADATTRSGDGDYQIQVGATRNSRDADRLAEDLREQDFAVFLDDQSRPGWIRILVGPVEDREAARNVESDLRKAGYETWVQRRN